MNRMVLDWKAEIKWNSMECEGTEFRGTDFKKKKRGTLRRGKLSDADLLNLRESQDT